ncbi:MAG: phosphopyruvate hydratase [Ruminiclostridium sp.]
MSDFITKKGHKTIFNIGDYSKIETVIKNVSYRKIFDSRGVETLEVDIETQNGFGRVAAPFGAPGSRGEFEAPAYAPEGIEASIKILKDEIIPALIGIDATEQEKVDELLKKVDGTPNFDRIGGNTATVISVACAKAAADSLKTPLFKLVNKEGGWTIPFPLGNIIGGGAHSLGPAPDMQEHLIVPIGVKSMEQGIRINLLVHDEVGKLLEKKDRAFAGGTDDENAWTADLNDVEAFMIMDDACKKISQSEGVEIRMGLDLAADRIWDPEKKVYNYIREGVIRTTEEQLDFLTELVEKFNLIYVEDAFNSNDYESFATLNARVGHRCLVCADDLYASNPERTEIGIKAKSAKIMILKTNQVGTVSGAKTTAMIAQKNGTSVILSHRSGETVDDSISHFAVAWNALMIKTGVKGGERLAKLNEIIRIEQEYKDIKMVKWPKKYKF